MRFVQLGQGFVTKRPPGPGPGAIAAGPRLAVLDDGDVLCSCMLTAALGTNDFVPMLYRSRDAGETWVDQGAIWPYLTGRYSCFVSISRDLKGNVYAFGSRCSIETPGETFWSDATQGLKQNELIWACSTDGGRTWPEPTVIPMPIPGSAEAPGALCVSRTGRWLAPYSPYNTFDPGVKVDRAQVVNVFTDDRGQTWRHAAMLRFPDETSTAAEAWLVELEDGRLLGTAWHLNSAGERPNAFAISLDHGQSWLPTRSTGILGQSTALAGWSQGRALFIYNQRKHGEIGVWLAVVRPTNTEFGVQAHAPIWRAEAGTRSGSSGEHDQWEDFLFGEPSIAVLPDRTLLSTLWCTESTGSGIRYVKLKIEDN